MERTDSSEDDDSDDDDHHEEIGSGQPYRHEEGHLVSTGTDTDDEADPDWASLEEDISHSDNDDDEKERKLRLVSTVFHLILLCISVYIHLNAILTT